MHHAYSFQPNPLNLLWHNNRDVPKLQRHPSSPPQVEFTQDVMITGPKGEDTGTTKYCIRGKIEIDGVVETPDVVGALFGQTEGLHLIPLI